MSQVTNNPLQNTFQDLPGLGQVGDAGNIDAIFAKQMAQVKELLTNFNFGTTTGLQGGVADPTMPKLAIPTMLMGSLSLETLVDAVGTEERKQATKDGVSNLKARGEERAEVNKKNVEEIQKQVDEMKSKGVLDVFKQIFKWIGIALGAIASAVTIAIGAITANPLLIAAGVIGMYMAVDSLISEASGGKAGIGLGFIAGQIAKAAGASEEVQTWLKFGFDMATTVVMIGLSCGAAAAGSAATVGTKIGTQAGEAATKIMGTVSKVTTGINAGVSIASGATGIASAVQDKKVADSQAMQKELQAILERIAMANDLDLAHMKAMMEKSEQVLQQVSDIVKGAAETQTAILTGSAPSMA